MEHFISLEGAEIAGAAEYEELLDQAEESEPKRPAIDADDGYCILYTSGTTGKPKGAVLPHRQVLWNAINTVVSWGLSENDISPDPDTDVPFRRTVCFSCATLLCGRTDRVGT